MNAPEPWSSASGWREFFDLLTDGVVVFDNGARVVLANTAALRLLPCEIGVPVEQFQATLGAEMVRWLRDAATATREPEAAPPTRLADGRALRATWRRLDAQHGAMHVAPEAHEPPAAVSTPWRAGPYTMPVAGMRETIAFLWQSPFPTLLQDQDFRILDVNQPFLDFIGLTRSATIGRDPIDWRPAEDRVAALAARHRLHASRAQAVEPALVDSRLVDSSGRERRYRASRRTLIDETGRHLYLAVLQDTTGEHIALERADRSRRELDDWFDLSPVGMVLSDAKGLLVRTNPAFDALAGPLSISLAEAPTGLRELLGWRADGSAPALHDPSEPSVQRQGWVTPPGQDARLLRASVRSYRAIGGQQRTMAVIEDRSAEEELLHELTTILDSASTGIAYLRGGVVARCNRRFETMLGAQGAGSLLGSRLEQALGGQGGTDRVAIEAYQAIEEGSYYETEFDLEVEADGLRRVAWYSLSVRPAGQTAGVAAAAPARVAIAVLSDVTRLKARQHEFEILARESELMFNLSGVGIAFWRDDMVQRANPAFLHLVGFGAGELGQIRNDALSADPDEHRRRWPTVQASLHEYGRWTGERPMRTRDGRVLWVQESMRLVVEGEPAGGIIASYVNVDARYRAERAVATQASRTRSILDSVLVGIVTVGPQGIEWMNRSARRMFAGDLVDFVNLPIATVATAEPDHPFRRTEYLTELDEGQTETFECHVVARDGRRFWVVGNVVSTARESTGRQLTYALLDIERRREAEARVLQAQAQLQRIIEAAPLAITLRDARTLKVLQVNGVAAASAHTTPEAMIGLTPEQLHPDPQTAAEHRRDMQQALATSEVSKREYRLEQDGQLRVWDARYLPLADAPGAPPDQLLLVATDVTEQRAAQEARLEAAIAQREMLVKEVHHRIKNNLQGVAGLLQQIAQRKPEVAGPIAEVVGQVQAIAQVYGLQVGASGPLALVGVVRAITGSVQRTFGRTIRFDVRGHEAERWQLPEAESIPIALTLNELLTNAVKHSAAEPDADVLCTLHASEQDVQVLIANRGRLADDFNLAGVPSGVSGLGLVRALLPRRSARFSLEQQGDQVLTTVMLWAPGVVSTATASATRFDN